MENIFSAPVPSGFHVKISDRDRGFVIENDQDGSRFTWVPVDCLKENGTLDGKNYNSRFGARPFQYSGSPRPTMNDELKAQYESVQKYGGFYISTYVASRGDDGLPVFNGAGMPWVRINLPDSQKAVHRYGNKLGLACHLPYAAEQDSVFELLVENNFLDTLEIYERSTLRDNMRTRDPVNAIKENVRYTLGLCDFAGQIDEWTQDIVDTAFIRCGETCRFPATSHCYFRPYSCYAYAGFRAVMCLD